MITPHNTKNQHYVWRHYLNSWLVDGRFYCYRQREKKLFPTLPKAIANEAFFYEIEQLSDSDLKFLNMIVNQATDDRLRKLNRRYIYLTQRTFSLREKLGAANLSTEERAFIEKKLRWVERNLVERYHATVETKCLRILESLRRGDESFYQDEARCIDFLHFLMLQYFRTAKMRNELSSIHELSEGHNPHRTAPILNHIFAVNVGSELFRERHSYRIIFLRNGTSIPFIAGDQPVLNMLDPKMTDDLEFYYPQSPWVAMVLTKDTARFPEAVRSVSQLEVERYNHEIYRNSEDQIYCHDDVYLRRLVSLDKRLI